EYVGTLGKLNPIVAMAIEPAIGRATPRGFQSFLDSEIAKHAVLVTTKLTYPPRIIVKKRSRVSSWGVASGTIADARTALPIVTPMNTRRQSIVKPRALLSDQPEATASIVAWRQLFV